MKRIFISHPYANDPEANKQSADNICRYVCRLGYLPLSPLHMFSFIDNENDYIRHQIMKVCYKLINMSDEIWIFGNSEGCQKELKYARKHNKKIILFYQKTKHGYKYYENLMKSNKEVILS